MNTHILKKLALVLLFLGGNAVFAQEQATKSPPNVARFITIGFKPVEFANDRFNLYEFELGYEQFITRNTSIIGGISYGTGKSFIKNIQGETLHEFDHKRYSIFAGVRSRLLNKGKFSLFGELQAGIRIEEYNIVRTSISTLGFYGAGLGAEYRFSERMKGIFGITSLRSSTTGLETSFNIGFQFRLGRKK